MTDQINKTTVLEALGDECGLTRQEKKLRLGFIKNINALPPVRFTREDVEKVAREIERVLFRRVAARLLEGYTIEASIEAATAALSAIGEVEHG